MALFFKCMAHHEDGKSSVWMDNSIGRRGMDMKNTSTGSTPIAGWGRWQQWVAYLFAPENSASSEPAAGRAGVPAWIAQLKTVVWISLSLAAALMIAQL